MDLHTKTLIVTAVCGFILVSCAPQKKEESPSLPAEAPLTQPEEVSPAETQGLTPHQQEELKINEDNVANPFPG